MTGVRDKVWRKISNQRLRKTFLDLLDIYSPSGKEEDIQLYLEGLLRGAGLQVHRQEVEEDRYNLLVTMGRGPAQLFLVGHVDTVPAWDLELLGAVEEEDVVRALGSADMKGGCAAMVEAFIAITEALPEHELPPVGLLLAVGEEENGDGSARFLEHQRPPWVVIGEPTGLAPCFAHYGYIEAGFVTRGRRSHSSLPERGHNAVESMLRVLLHLGKDPLFDRERTELIYSIREMTSARTGFAVPDRCETWIDIHLPPDKNPVYIQERIRQIAAAAGSIIPDLLLDINFDLVAGGYRLEQDNCLIKALEPIYGELGLPLRLDAFRSHSDGNLFFAAGVKPVILGPGDLDTAHSPEEQVRLHEVAAAARIYAALCLAVGEEEERRSAVE